MKEAKAMAYVNAYGVLATLENLCAMDDEAKAVCRGLKKPVSLCFDVTDGPCVTYNFTNDGCKMTEGDYGCTCKMKFSSPEKFNALIDSSKPGVPTKNIPQVLSFLMGPFTKLTDRLTKFLMPSDEDLKNKDFFEKSTILTMYTIGGAICALGNTDSISTQSASYICDGDIQMGITDKVYVTIRVRNHQLQLIKEKPDTPRAIMEFKTVELANGLFNGTASTISELCAGNIYMSGMINMIDNINRILDRVATYLG
ncbi:MAG: hypothetical protein SO393_04005 [Eubacterium sp.]|nr:hypothetical protein [Oscillospiraceae bacterium]MDD6355760.1 hypothetical protein [Oscillospiraceae bacterium]MDY4608051.1 hypothetical protein [Eubacterium sp.]